MTRAARLAAITRSFIRICSVSLHTRSNFTRHHFLGQRSVITALALARIGYNGRLG
jgi:hypothetical protein